MLAAKNYYNWIDYAKFLSIFLVVFFHAPPKLDGFAGTFLSLVRMPMFFFLSGLLFKREKYRSFAEFVKHRSKQLLIPYFCFFALFYTYWLIYGKNHGDQDDLAAPVYQPVVEYLLGTPNLVCKPLWFIPCLFVIQCLFYIFFRKMNRIYATPILLLFPLIPHFIDLSNAPFSLSSVCLGIPFYGIASLYQKEIIKFINGKWVSHGIIFTVLSGIYFVLVNYITYSENSVEVVMAKMIASLFAIFPILIIMKYLAHLFGSKELINKFSSNAIITLAFHTYSIIGLQKIINILIYDSQKTMIDHIFVYKFSIAIMSTISMIIPIWLINKYAPFVLGKEDFKLKEKLIRLKNRS